MNLPDGFAEAVNYPIPLEAGQMYWYYWDGERWIDVRFLDHFPERN